MATNKQSFVLYCDLVHTVRKLSDEQAGKLFKHILEYVNDQDPDACDPLIDIVFEPIKQSLKRDLDKYYKTVERNRVNGSKGGRPTKPKESEKTQSVISKPKKADSDTDSDTVIDTSNDVNKPVDESTLHALQIYVRDNYPNVSSLKTQLTKEQCERLLGAYTKDAIKTKLDAMENKPNLKKNYLAVYNTLNNWLSMERQRNPNFGKLPLTPEQELEILKKERGYHVE